MFVEKILLGDVTRVSSARRTSVEVEEEACVERGLDASRHRNSHRISTVFADFEGVDRSHRTLLLWLFADFELPPR